MKKLNHYMRAKGIIGLIGSTSLIAIAATPAFAQQSENVDASAADEIIVTGFRASLEEALDVKLNTTSQVDVILAEDIGKFPDQNLAESLQRIPGVAIERDAGEGRAITVRGLGSQFTRVRVNGMETIATSTDGASANRDRAFDFNVFASELFNSLVVHKTAEASLDEGSLGAVVDLNTGNALAYDPGVTFVVSAQGRYNDLNDDLSPRLVGLVGWTNADQTFGVSASVAYSDYETAELGNNSVRWQKARFNSVDGVNCTANPADAGCVEVADAFHPRIPRYGLVNHDRKRLGATASVQFKPADSTTISIDGLYSSFKENRDEYWGEVLLRSQEPGIDLSNYVIDGNNNIISANLDNVYVRTERYHRESKTEFYQLSGRIEHDFSDTLHVDLHGGFSQSDASIPIETTLLFDDRDATNYSYDYSDMKSPLLVFGDGNVDNPAAFQLAEFRDRPSSLTNKFKTVGLDIDWEAADGFSLKAGGAYRKFTFDTEGYRRDSAYCSAFTCAPGTYGLQVTDALAETFNLGDAGQPSGNTNSWIVPNLAAGVDAVDLYNQPASFRQDEKRFVSEEVKTVYLEANFDTDVFGLRMTGNAGMRYAQTNQASKGYVSGQYVTVKRDYDDFLPSMNVNLFLKDNLVLRGAIADVMTRPSLGSLTPGGSVSDFAFTISQGNPFIEPYRAMNLDLALEYYFMPGGLLSVAVFKKNIESFPVGQSLSAPFSASGLPGTVFTPGAPTACAVIDNTPSSCGGIVFNPNQNFEYRTTINGEGASLKGIELSAQIPFELFSDSLNGFGILANVTLVDSKVDYNVGGNIYTRPLFPVSKKAANGTIYYDKDKLSVRVSGSYRGGYITSTSGNGNIFEGFDPSFNLDAAIRYELTDQIQVSLDATNLTDDYRYRWTDDFARRNYENNHYGRTFTFGVRYQM